MKTEQDDWQAPAVEVPAIRETSSKRDIPGWKFPKGRFVGIL